MPPTNGSCDGAATVVPERTTVLTAQRNCRAARSPLRGHRGKEPPGAYACGLRAIGPSAKGGTPPESRWRRPRSCPTGLGLRVLAGPVLPFGPSGGRPGFACRIPRNPLPPMPGCGRCFRIRPLPGARGSRASYVARIVRSPPPRKDHCAALCAIRIQIPTVTVHSFVRPSEARSLWRACATGRWPPGSMSMWRNLPRAGKTTSRHAPPQRRPLAVLQAEATGVRSLHRARSGRPEGARALRMLRTVHNQCDER
jgi:hypothetical protein